MDEQGQKTKALLLIIASGICGVLIVLGIAFAVNGIKQVTCKHIWNEGKTITEPTCAVEGEYEYECEKCGKTDVKTLDKVACATSTMLTVEAKEVTCTEDGHTKYTICTVCNEYAGSEPEITEALGHNEVNSQQEEIPATCTERGITQGTYCDRCGVIIKQQEILPALGHKIVAVEGVEPTCTAGGVEQGQKCERCNTVYWGCAELPALGHNIVMIEGKEPTCTETGTTEGEKCTHCDFESGCEEIEANGHYWFELERKEPTCTKSGWSIAYECVGCGLIEAEELPATGVHDWVKTFENPFDGSEIYECRDCRATKSE